MSLALLNSQLENPSSRILLMLPQEAYSLSSSMERTKAWNRRKIMRGTVIRWRITQLLWPYTLIGGEEQEDFRVG